MGSLFPAAKQVARKLFGKASVDLRSYCRRQRYLTLDFLPMMQSLNLQTTFMAIHQKFFQFVGHSIGPTHS